MEEVVNELQKSGGTAGNVVAAKTRLPAKSKRIIILGLGNLLFTDEGMGIHAIRRILKHAALPPEIEVVDGNTMGIELLNHVEAATHLLILDAVDIGKTGGSLCVMDGKDIPKYQGVKISQHQQSFKEILGVAMLRGRLPEHMALVGVQPDNFEWGLKLSPKVEAAMEQVLGSVWGRLAEWGIPIGNQFERYSKRPKACDTGTATI